MRTMRILKTKVVACALLLASQAFQTAGANDLIAILDGLQYRLNGQVEINLNDGEIRVDGGMRACQRFNGGPPLSTEPFTLLTSTQNIGLLNFNYNISSRSVLFYSESGDLDCLNAIGTDVLFRQGYETASSPIFFNGFE